MLKTVSSVANALGALNYKGTWDAATNTPTLASGVGTQGDYYVVSVAGTTDLDGITNWGVGAIVENLGVNVSSITSGFRAEIYEPSNDGLNIQAGNAGAKKILSLGSAGTPDKIVFTAGGDIDMTAGGSILMKDGKGIDFSATAGTGTSELLDDYEEGVWTPTFSDSGAGGNTSGTGVYTKIGNKVTVHGTINNIDTTGLTSGNKAHVYGLPFTCVSSQNVIGNVWFGGGVTTSGACSYYIQNSGTYGRFFESPYTGTSNILSVSDFTDDAADILINATYIVA
jgi:hypothetical protein